MAVAMAGKTFGVGTTYEVTVPQKSKLKDDLADLFNRQQSWNALDAQGNIIGSVMYDGNLFQVFPLDRPRRAE